METVTKSKLVFTPTHKTYYIGSVICVDGEFIMASPKQQVIKPQRREEISRQASSRCCHILEQGSAPMLGLPARKIVINNAKALCDSTCLSLVTSARRWQTDAVSSAPEPLTPRLHLPSAAPLISGAVRQTEHLEPYARRLCGNNDVAIAGHAGAYVLPVNYHRDIRKQSAGGTLGEREGCRLPLPRVSIREDDFKSNDQLMNV